MDSSSCHELPSPKSLRSLVCKVTYPHGNFLIHQFVLNNYRPSDHCSEADIRAVLWSFPGGWENARNEDGFTALHLAVIKRNSFMVKMLLSCLPTIDVDAERTKGGGGTALKFAAFDYYFESAFSNTENNYSTTGLDKASKEECLEIMRVLVESGAVIDIKNMSGGTLLHTAVINCQTDMIKSLISLGAKLNIRDKKGETALHEAIWKSSLETVKLLVESGADVNVKSNFGLTPFHLVITLPGNHMDIIEYLCRRNVDLNTVNKDGWTPLHTAVEKMNLKLVSNLVKKGALLNSKSNCGETPLHIASRKNHFDIVRVLISNGADVNVKDCSSKTPLHEAVSNDCADWDRKSCFKIAEVLVKSGAVVDAMETAISIAKARNFTDIVELLKSRVAVSAADVDNTSILEAPSSNTTVSGQLPFKKRRTSET